MHFDWLKLSVQRSTGPLYHGKRTRPIDVTVTEYFAGIGLISGWARLAVEKVGGRRFLAVQLVEKDDPAMGIMKRAFQGEQNVGDIAAASMMKRATLRCGMMHWYSSRATFLAGHDPLRVSPALQRERFAAIEKMIAFHQELREVLSLNLPEAWRLTPTRSCTLTVGECFSCHSL